MNKTKVIGSALASVMLASALSSCASMSSVAEGFKRAMEGNGGSFRTYSKTGATMDNITGSTLRVTREQLMDQVRDDGTTEKGSVMQVQVGQNFIRHVGSTAMLVENGLEVTAPADKGFPQGVTLENTKGGTPWLNKFLETNRNLWRGSSKTVLVRTQDDVVVGVFSGKEVEFVNTDIPKSTAFRVTGMDGKARYALVYRANYTIYETALLAGKLGSDKT